MVGACAAYALAGKGFRIALIEAGAPDNIDPGPDDDQRLSAISPDSRGILEQLGVWQQLDNDRV